VLPLTPKESGVNAFLAVCRLWAKPTLHCLWLSALLPFPPSGVQARAQTIETTAGTVTVHASPGKTTEQALTAALRHIRGKAPARTQDDPRAVFALRQTGATLLTDASGNITSLSFSQAGTESNDLRAAAKFTDKATPHLKALVGLRTLDLSGAKISNDSLDVIGKLSTLVNLQLASTGIDDRGLAPLAPLVELRYLDIGNCNISGPGLKHLAHFDRLLSIDLTGDPVSNESLVDLVEMESLQRIYLTGTLVTDAGIPTLAKLEHLKVVSLYATRVSDAALRTLSEIPHLETLYLEKSLVTPAGVNWLKNERPQLRIYGP
jgi:hypothetical protein